ncbi:MAG TPA: hypothetical protein VMU02_00655 [bacterium]|nr:hypothetical protein [bacterium]
MSGNRRMVSLLVAVALAVFLLCSCGNDNGGGPHCVNCDFWAKAFGGIGHYPAPSPVADSRLLAFTSTATRDTTGGSYSHVWVAELAQAEGDTTVFYHITTGEVYDTKPSWSPDGHTLAFERQTGEVTDIYTVDVTDPASPGTPVGFTVGSTDYNSFYSPGWAVVGQDTFIVFSAATKGGGDYDVVMKRFPDDGQLVRVTIDPADFAKSENSVLSAVFKDEHTATGGGKLVAFASPDRVFVCDIAVRARSVEKPDTTEKADIWINGKDSGKDTPYVFKYRPATMAKIELRGKIVPRYCTDAVDSVIVQPGIVNDFVLDFVYTKGTVGLNANDVTVVYFDGALAEGVRTPGIPGQYVYLTCVKPGDHSVYAANTITHQQCSPTYQITVAAGETTFVDMVCGSGGGLAQAPAKVKPAAVLGASRAVPASGSNGLWLLDLPDTGPATDATIYLAASSNLVIDEPAVSPDGKYVAYIKGQGESRQIIVSDLSGLLDGGGQPAPITIGMPGSVEDIECWRIPERVTWFPGTDQRKLVASFSTCRSGASRDYQIWIADLDRFIK